MPLEIESLPVGIRVAKLAGMTQQDLFGSVMELEPSEFDDAGDQADLCPCGNPAEYGIHGVRDRRVYSVYRCPECRYLPEIA